MTDAPVRGPWEVIARADKYNKAVRTDTIEHKGRRIRADLIKPLHGDGYWYYAGSGIRIRKATPSEVDAKTDYRRYVS